MTKNCQTLTEHPTPDELLASLTRFVPEFEVEWKRSNFRNEDGSFTVHGVFAEFSAFFRDHVEEMEESTRRDLFTFVEDCVTTDPTSEAGLSNAACTCFLENLAGEGKISDLVSKYLGPESKAYFDKWN